MLEKQDIEIIAGIMMKALDPVLERLDRIEQRMDALEQRVDVLEQRMDSLEQRMERMEKSHGTLVERVGRIDLLLENDAQRGIRTIAEGHLDLSRNLDEAMITKNEREMILLRLSKVERDVKCLQRKAKRA